ncbi:hypothetical protein PILCRDRAFT_614813 [Piloderma croceum F 1598]|uniref:Uncharacterized protein n=1 Tax=Piloderma croceum (strain F 1598) TaxID=765440 RepID=A0A0C3FD35_PILCF|nr:hypothetical protein PILCRDRAFT_614813 [Piloderma croceum F 1598]
MTTGILHFLDFSRGHNALKPAKTSYHVVVFLSVPSGHISKMNQIRVPMLLCSLEGRGGGMYGATGDGEGIEKLWARSTSSFVCHGAVPTMWNCGVVPGACQGVATGLNKPLHRSANWPFHHEDGFDWSNSQTHSVSLKGHVLGVVSRI